MTPRLYHLHAMSALHCGTGQSVGVIDLPIARDRATHLPLVPGSSLRGVLRDTFDRRDKALTTALFGPRGIDGNDQACEGALAVGDAHLLLLPVRALAGIVAYATCPFILRRYAADLPPADRERLAEVPAPGATEAIHAKDNLNAAGGKVVLEDLDLSPRHAPPGDRWAEAIAQAVWPDDADARGDLQKRFLVLPDNVFAFLAETATEIRARIAVDPDTGTVKPGALWYEENLPAETVLWGIYALGGSRVLGDGARTADVLARDLAHALAPYKLLQLGGKAGVGRGLTRFIPRGVQ